MSKFHCTDKAEASVQTNKKPGAAFKLAGHWDFVCIDADGKVKWEEKHIHNLVTDEGIDEILDVMFTGSSQTSPWFVLLKGAGTALAADTLASQANWSEFADYTGTRQTFVEAAASGQSLTNSASPAAFPITGSGTVAGAGLASVTSGTSGILFSAVDFSASRSVSNGDTINVTYTVSGADDGA